MTQNNKSAVYFLPIEKVSDNTLTKLFETAGFDSMIAPGDLVAVKMHFGELGNTAYLKPPFVKPIVDKISSLQGKPFLTDANTLYRGARGNAVDHINTAKAHGYDFAPVIIADGLEGKDFHKVIVDLKHFKEVRIGSASMLAGSLVVLTHFKGHEVTGFGGALKNVGMGLGARSGKQLMHSDVHPEVAEDKCTGCELCTQWCPADAITMENGKAKIHKEKCIGCAECIVTCRFNAISIEWAGSPAALQEKMVEYCFGALKGKKAAFINVINNVSPNCDCWNFTHPPVVNDIGILASFDPVAIDQASLDLVNKTAGEDIFKKTWPEVDHNIQLEYAEKIGLGKRGYRLEEMS